MIRFHSLIRVIFTNKKIKNRPQRDFLREKINSKEKFINYLKKMGFIFLETALFAYLIQLLEDR